MELLQEEQDAWNEMGIEAHVALYEKQGLDRREAMKRTAKDRGLSKREVYAMLLEAADKG
jgi:16S rRNA (cytidine1402-2'-O)-methyltransferase